MTYPNTILTRRLRRTFMGLLFLLFFIISPLVLLYTAGYRYDAQNRLILQTGVISIDVEPDTATVYIGDSAVQDSLPLRITNVAPGSYPVRIEAEGYRTFSADLTVRSNETAFIRNLTLVAEYSPVPFLTVTSSDVMFSASGKFAVQQNENKLQTIDLQTAQRSTYDIRSNTHVSPFSEAFAELQPASGTWRITLQQFGQDSRADDVLIPRTNQELSWHWNKGARVPSLYARVGDVVWRIENGKREEISNVESELWHVDDRGVLWQLAGSNMLEQTKEPAVHVQIESGVKKIIDISDERILLSYGDTVRIYDRRTNQMQTISGSIANMRYSPDRELWLLTAGNELWEISDRGNIQLLERVSDTITSAYAIPQSSYVVYTTSNNLVLLDTFFGLRYVLVNDVTAPQVHGATNDPIQVVYSQGEEFYTIAIE